MSLFKIQFSGNFTELENSLKEKFNDYPSIKVQKLNDQSAIVSAENNNLLDEMSFLKNQELPRGIVITEIDENVTEEDKAILAKSSTMDYEVINKSDFEIKDDRKVENINSIPKGERFNKQDALDNISKAIMNASLPSKTPLRKEDPFYITLQKDFLLYASAGAAAIVFLGSLF